MFPVLGIEGETGYTASPLPSLAMPSKTTRKPFIPVDELMEKLPEGRERIEKVAAYYSAELPALKQTRNEIRSKCFLHCGKTKQTSDRALAIAADDPGCRWHCFEGGCGMSGNLLTICHLLRGENNASVKLRGDAFKAVAADLEAMVSGDEVAADRPAPGGKIREDHKETQASQGNTPLAESANERARALVSLDEKFVVNPGQMPPAASRFLRMHPFLTPEVCEEARMGFLPRDGGEDKSGGTMRGLWVSAYNSEEGKLLTWFGRHVDLDERLKAWEASDKSNPKPGPFKFTKGFLAGQELYGQDRIMQAQEEVREKLQGLGLFVVSDPVDVFKMRSLGSEAVATCLEGISREQAVKVARLAREVSGGIATVLFDVTDEGEKCMKQVLGYLAQVTAVRIPITSKTFGGKFRGITVASLKKDEWDKEIGPFLRTGEPESWRFG